ncbi:MAG: hypothetical protein ACD_62C00645G0009 [uncultured bacterium]|nr:MAG: hypothetical protein ACD_62C00645G0009 [uncultured bacterium]
MTVSKSISITQAIENLRQNAEVAFSPEELLGIQEALVQLEREQGNSDALLSFEEWQNIKTTPRFQGLFSGKTGNKLLITQDAVDTYFQTPAVRPQQNEQEYDFYADVQEQRQDFLRQLRLIKGSGYQLNPLSRATAIYTGHIGPTDPMVQAFFSLQQNNTFLITDKQGWSEGNNIPFLDYGDMTPDDVLRQAGVVPLELDSRLLQTEQLQFNLFPYTIHAWSDGSRYGIIAWNWFEEKPLFSSTCEASRDAVQEMATQAYKKLKRNYRTFNFDRAINKMEPLTSDEQQKLHDSKVIKLDTPPAWTSVEVEQAFLAQSDLMHDFNLSITAHPCDADIDRESGRSTIVYGSLNVSINPEALLAAQQPMMLNGLVDVVSLRVKDMAKAKTLGGQLVAYEEQNKPLFDKYGNAIFIHIGRERTTDEPVLVGFDIIPGYSYSHEQPSGDTFMKHGLDLSALGFGDFEICLPLRKVFPARFPDRSVPYFLYEFIEDDTLVQNQVILSTVSQAVAKAEQVFGLEPGQAIQNIAYLPSSERNAAVSFGNPDTVTIWDEMLPTMSESHGAFIVAHETYHALDFQYDFCQYPEFQTFFNRLDYTLDEDFFDAVQEKNMFNIKEGGHPQTDVFELFASMISSVFAPKWESEIAEMSDRVRGLYYNALCFLERALLSENSELEKAPVILNIRNKIQTLNKSYGPFQVLSSYYLTSVSETLSEHSDVLPMITADSFDEQVLDAPGYVVVYSYKEDEREIAPHVLRYAETHASEATYFAMPYPEVETYLDRDFSRLGPNKLALLEACAFGRSTQSAGIYVFKNGQRIYQPGSGESLYSERDQILGQVTTIIFQGGKK